MWRVVDLRAPVPSNAVPARLRLNRDPAPPCALPLVRGSRSHFAHIHLWHFARKGEQGQYEEIRTVYNPVRPVGYPPAPPFEDLREVTDICDHAYCR